VVAHTCNLSTEEAETEGSQIQGWPGIYRGGGGATKLVKYFDTVISFLELYFFKGTPKVGGGRNNWKKKDSHSHDK
jgi:hypothetical protein